MIPKRREFEPDLNGEAYSGSSSPSQQDFTEPATSAGFSFLKTYGDKMGTKTKYSHYRPAQIHDKGDKWFVWYSYRSPLGEMKRFRVYEDLNRIKDPKEKKEYADELRRAVDYLLTQGFNPFNKPLEQVSKTWSFVQGINFFKLNLQNRGLRPRSIQSYESTIRMIYDAFRPVLLSDITQVTKSQISNLLKAEKQKSKWSNSTFNNNLTILRTIFNFLIESEILVTNPAKAIKPLPADITRHRYFDEQTFSRIKEKANPELLEFLMFLYHTGTRPNEARQLKHEHILRDRKLLFVPASISKNKKEDYVPLSDYILENFKGEGFIFGKSVNYFTQKFNKLKKELNLSKDVTLYAIKHTRAIHLAEDGASPYAVMQLFRHSSLDITMSYLRGLGLNIGREAAEKAR